MKIRKKALLYDISNMAYLIADTGQPLNHTLHRVRDICQSGNIDRVSRVLGLYYSRIISVLSPIIISPHIDIDKDNSASPHDYEINFKHNHEHKFSLSTETKLRIKESAHEYMVAMVLADWLSITLPEAADVWKFKADCAFESIQEILASALSSSSLGLRRKISPF